MSIKDDIKAQLDKAGIVYTADMTVTELKALLPKEDTLTPKVQAVKPQVGDYSWAVNKIKLNRAIAHVRAMQPAVAKGADFDAAVKDRYTEIKGLLIEDKAPARKGKSRGAQENVAANDEE